MTIPQNEKSQQCWFNFRRKRLKQKDLFLTMSTRRPHIEKSPAMCGALLFVLSGARISLNNMFNKEINLKPFKTVVLLALTLTSFTALANDTSTLKKSLKPWQPVEVSKSGDTLTVVLNENQITSDVYETVISSGACMDIWTKDVPAKYLQTVKELRILNKHKAQGYVLEKPLNTCNEMGKEQPERAKVIMLANTHLF
ncbi:hypothetical protein [Enterobacter hormaechei]|uniref:hypothetical protein n=1 Tax=Enterobacter hormaechei TaxID=158836 RepID=UPI001EDAF31A|nr:hypothetical protein [Enterobacter hormaechei]